MGVLLWLWVIIILIIMLVCSKINRRSTSFDFNKYWDPSGDYNTEFKYDLKFALCLVVTVCISALLYKYINHKAPDLPDSFLKKHWSSSSEGIVNASTRPFKVIFEDKMVFNLKNYLSKYKLPKSNYEAMSNSLDTVVSFWRDKYNFKERENFLNKYPQYTKKIQGLDIHFLHIKPEQTDYSVRVLPLLLIHGFVSSVREFYDFIPLLTTPRRGTEFVFEVIAPSLPGWGFSEIPTKPGLDELEASIILRNLMKTLGYDKFIVQGIDEGSVVGAYLVTFFPNEVIGYHSNKPMVHGPARKRNIPSINLKKNPIALASYIFENLHIWPSYKFSESTDGFDVERFIDNLMIHWISNSTSLSAELYADTLRMNWDRNLKMSKISTRAPAAFIDCQNDKSAKLPSELKLKYRNIVHYTHFEATDHFTFSKRHELIDDDLREAVKMFLQYNTML